VGQAWARGRDRVQRVLRASIFGTSGGEFSPERRPEHEEPRRRDRAVRRGVPLRVPVPGAHQQPERERAPLHDGGDRRGRDVRHRRTARALGLGERRGRLRGARLQREGAGHELARRGAVRGLPGVDRVARRGLRSDDGAVGLPGLRLDRALAPLPLVLPPVARPPDLEPRRARLGVLLGRARLVPLRLRDALLEPLAERRGSIRGVHAPRVGGSGRAHTHDARDAGGLPRRRGDLARVPGRDRVGAPLGLRALRRATARAPRAVRDRRARADAVDDALPVVGVRQPVPARTPLRRDAGVPGAPRGGLLRRDGRRRERARRAADRSRRGAVSSDAGPRVRGDRRGDRGPPPRERSAVGARDRRAHDARRRVALELARRLDDRAALPRAPLSVLRVARAHRARADRAPCADRRRRGRARRHGLRVPRERGSLGLLPALPTGGRSDRSCAS
jgi:hypothetical protein